METEKNTGAKDNSAINEGFDLCFKEYVSSLEESWKVFNKTIAEAQTAYNNAVYTCSSTDPKASSEPVDGNAVIKEYVKSVRTATDAANADYKTAFTRYLDLHKGAWKSIDIKEFPSESLACISNYSNVAANYSVNIVGNTNNLAASCVPPWLMSYVDS